jgi:hypothetical protein
MRLLILLLLASCSSKTITPRTSLVMGELSSFLYSNGATHPLNSIEQAGKNKFEISYSVIVKNKSLDQKNLNISNSSITLNEQETPINCSFFNSNKKMSVLPKEGLSEIQCKFIVSANEANQLESKDTIGKIQIGLNDENIYFDYKFKIEDFKNEQNTSINSDADRARK